MLEGFFRSKEFFAALAVALVVIAGGALAFYPGSSFGLGVTEREACEAPRLDGAALEPARSESTRQPRLATHERVVEYTLNASAAPGVRSDLCVAVGDVRVAAAPSDSTVVRFTIRADGAGAEESVRIADVEAAFTRAADGTLRVAAWQGTSARVSGWFGNRDNVRVDVDVLLPQQGPQVVDARSSVGDVVVSGILAGDLDLSTSVGDVRVEGVDAQGNATLRADVGDVHYGPASVQTGRVRIVTDVGESVVELPRRADVGYHVVAETSVGDVTVDIGETEDRQATENRPGERVEARTRGFATAPTHVTLDVIADVGDITIRTL